MGSFLEKMIAAGMFLLLIGIPCLFVAGCIINGTIWCIKRISKKYRLKHQTNYVIENSKLLEKLYRLNKQYLFFDVDSEYTFARKCRSKAEYDRLNLRDYFEIVIAEKKRFFVELQKKEVHNKDEFEKYYKEYQRLLSLVDDEGLESKYRKTEREVLEKNRLKPVTDVKIVVSKEYTSPKGRKWYHQSASYSLNLIDSILALQVEEKKKKLEYKAFVSHERALMTDKLRYEIMQRDEFKCVLCGATAKDGVKLHVDHIKPVSKGGKTEEANLRTLCDRCNLGKGDSFLERENI